MLVGVDKHSDFPVDVVGSLPRVGPDLGVDPELVAALRPDLVLASLTVPGHDKVVGALEARGLNVVAPAPRSLPDVYDNILEISGLLGVSERGAALVESMRQSIEATSAESSLRQGAAKPRILVEWWPKPVIVPGRQSWVTDLIVAAGGENPWCDVDVESMPVEPDEVRRRDPEAVVIAWCGVDPSRYRASEVYRRPWSGVSAIESNHVHSIPEAFLGRPGPRLVQGARALREVVSAVLDGPTSLRHEET